MKIIKNIFYVVLMLFLVSNTVYSQREVVDRIVAVVGDQVILASELASQLQLAALQSGKKPKTQDELVKLQKDILDQMISDRLFLIAAKKDTSISVRPEEVDQMLDDQVSRIAGNFKSYDDFLNALANEGLSVRDLKKKYRPEVENQLLKQRYIQKKLATVSISRHEVEEFYQKFKDSIPSQPEAVKLAHILLVYKPSQKIEDSVKQLAMSLRKKILDGADFATLSSTYSSSGAGANGGDLGYVSKEDVVPEFARAAFKLNVGEISGVIRTQFGYHIIKCEGKKGNRLKLRHILLAVMPSHDDSLKTVQLADSLLNVLNNGGDFEKLAKAYSDDNATRAQGGELGWFATAQLPPEFAKAVKGWKTPGQYKGPISSQYGLHILKLLDYQPAKHYTLKDDYDKIKELARKDKTGKIIDKWLAEIKSKTYIKYNLES